MKRYSKRLSAIFLTLVLLITAFPVNVSAAVNGEEKLNKKSATLYVGENITLKVTGTTNKVSWSSSNKKIASVNSKGKVTAKKAGKATIKAKVGNNTFNCSVTVKKNEINKKSISIYKYDTYKLKVKGISNSKIKWTSSNKLVAKIDKKGKLTANNQGKTTIKAKIGNKTYTCKVTVKKPALSKNKVTIYSGKSYNLNLLGAKASSVKWSSSNKSVLSVSKGKITAKKGLKSTKKVTITAKSGGAKYTCVVTVKPGAFADKDENGKGVTYKEEVLIKELEKQKKYTTYTPKNSANELGVVIPQNENTEQIKKGSVIILPDSKGEPAIALKVSSKNKSGSNYKIEGTSPELYEVFDDIDINESKSVTFDGFEYNEDIVSSVSYGTVPKASNGISEIDSQKSASINGTISGKEDLTMNLFDAKNQYTGITGSIIISPPTINAILDVDVLNKKLNVNQVKATLTESVTSTVTCTVNTAKTIYIGHQSISLTHGFYADAIFYLQLSADGKATFNNVITITNGFDYRGSTNKISTINENNISFEGTKAEINGKITLNPQLQIRWLGLWIGEDARGEIEVVKMSMNVGAGTAASTKIYDTTPRQCTDLTIYAILDLELKDDYGVGGIIKALNDRGITKVNLQWTFLGNDKNNKHRKAWHWEDGRRTDKDICTRKDDKSSDSENSAGSSGSNPIESENSTSNPSDGNGTNTGDSSNIENTSNVFKSGSIKMVRAGLGYTAILKTDGSLWMTGCNWYGQLGDGTSGIYNDRNTPVKVMTGVASVSTGAHHTAIIKTDGSLWMTGYNGNGQLGDGTSGSDNIRTTPVKVMTGVASVSCGESHTAILKTDGSLWTTGYNGSGQLGDGTSGIHNGRNAPVKVMTGVSAVSARGSYTAILKTDGSLWMTGSNYCGQLGDGTTTERSTPVKVMEGVASVSCGLLHTAILKTDGSLWTTGDNSHGQLGDGTTTNRSSLKKVMTGVSVVSSGDWYTSILKTDGSLWMTGYNYDGQLGDGTTTDRSTPVKVMEGVASVSCGSHTAILKPDGSLWMTGQNSSGELGDATTKDKSTPVRVF